MIEVPFPLPAVLHGPRVERRHVIVNGSPCWGTVDGDALRLDDGRMVALDGVQHLPPCTPSWPALSLARAGACSRPPASCSRHPCSRSAASVAPRAMALTSARPAMARRVPMNPPIAPAPTMQTFIAVSHWPFDSPL